MEFREGHIFLGFILYCSENFGFSYVVGDALRWVKKLKLYIYIYIFQQTKKKVVLKKKNLFLHIIFFIKNLKLAICLDILTGRIGPLYLIRNCGELGNHIGCLIIIIIIIAK